MKKALNLAANLLLLVLGAESIGALIANTFSISVPSQTWLWLALLCVLLWIATFFRKGILIGMPLCAAVLWILYKRDPEDLLIEFHDLPSMSTLLTWAISAETERPIPMRIRHPGI